MTKGGLLANIAYRTGERLYWDDAHERFTGQHARQPIRDAALPQALEAGLTPGAHRDA